MYKLLGRYVLVSHSGRLSTNLLGLYSILTDCQDAHFCYSFPSGGGSDLLLASVIYQVGCDLITLVCNQKSSSRQDIDASKGIKHGYFNIARRYEPIQHTRNETRDTMSVTPPTSTDIGIGIGGVMGGNTTSSEGGDGGTGIGSGVGGGDSTPGGGEEESGMSNAMIGESCEMNSGPLEP